MEETILIAISKWVVKNFKIAESLKNVGTEILEKTLWTPLKNRIVNFFDNEEETEEFVKKISVKEISCAAKPYRDIEDIFEEMKGKIPDMQLFETIVQFFIENQELIKNMNLSESADSQSKIVLNQQADKIFNAKVMTINNIE